MPACSTIRGLAVASGCYATVQLGGLLNLYADSGIRSYKIVTIVSWKQMNFKESET